jgi:hypothetical protein
MKKKTVAAGLLALAASSSLGCKTTPKLAFWKSNDAEATAIAHEAPAMPSEAAKLAASQGAASRAAGGDAAPFVPSGGAIASTMPASYPSTDAPAFTPDIASRAASAATATAAPSTNALTTGNLGSIAAAPYDPTRPPRPTVATTGPATSTLPASRYGAASTASPFGAPPTGAIAAAGAASESVPGLPPIGGVDSAASRYASVGATAPTSPTTAAWDSAVSRYGSAATAANNAALGAATTANNAASAVASVTTQPAPATTAAAQPYRPGGTGTYPSTSPTQPAVQVATRPQELVPPTMGASSVSPAASQTGLPATLPGSTGDAPAGRYR